MPRGLQKAKMPCDLGIGSSWRFQPLLSACHLVRDKAQGSKARKIGGGGAQLGTPALPQSSCALAEGLNHRASNSYCSTETPQSPKSWLGPRSHLLLPVSCLGQGFSHFLEIFPHNHQTAGEGDSASTFQKSPIVAHVGPRGAKNRTPTLGLQDLEFV